ncbi:hypothetical protein L198_07321 [Cryptococcus wingfieldii CBS 7118]|uniref:F-box domain-containing protein n=1 Tax=Cryptococcus wingfieldii CBS 7118 TaxID=1295528 RepID=A0A1E3ICG1_9TREE|nr:hypothetical protein L198_07321 [Cryptococcus wingfieldii CBS 7118]ODN86303.1 hypothetical protein L198_07321 [Cryptococcus wingfieldii CBS 7118]
MTSLDIPYSSLQRLEPVHYLILDHLFALAPTTILRLSKYHYERLLPRAYTCISLEDITSYHLRSLLFKYQDGVVNNVFPHPTLKPLWLYTSKLNFLDAISIRHLSLALNVPYLAKIQTIQFFPRCFKKRTLLDLEVMLVKSTNIHRAVVCYTAEDVRMGSPTKVPDPNGISRSIALCFSCLTFHISMPVLTGAEWQPQPLVKALDFLKYCYVGWTVRVIIDLGFASHCLSSDIVRLMGDELALIVGSGIFRQSRRLPLPLKLLFRYEGDVDLVEDLRGHIENRQRYLQANVSDIEEARLASQIEGYWREFVELRRIGGREMEELLL